MISSLMSTQKPPSAPEPVSGQSFRSKARFAGRQVRDDFVTVLDEVHFCTARPFGLLGYALGGAMGFVGGAVYKAAKCAMGQGAETKKLLDYAIKTGHSVRVAFLKPAAFFCLPVVIAAALPFAVCGVAGAVVGALATPVVAPIYKMVKERRGESVQENKLSDYIIKSAELGGKGLMCLAVFGLAVVLTHFCPPAVLYTLIAWEVTGCIMRLKLHNPPKYLPI